MILAKKSFELNNRTHYITQMPIHMLIQPIVNEKSIMSIKGK